MRLPRVGLRTQAESQAAVHLRAALLVVVGLGLTLSGMARAQAPPPVYSTPLGIALDEYPYPYPVQFLPLDIQGQKLRMAYMDIRPSSPESGRTVVLLHGKNFYGSYWENTIKALSAAGYRVIVPDQIGFGKSPKPDLCYSFDLLAANTARLLDHLGVKSAAIVGHSMGGMLAVRFARTYPERSACLILEDPIGLEDYRFFVPPQTTSQLVAVEMAMTPEKYRAFVHRYFVIWKPEYEPFVETRCRVALSGEFPRYAKAAALTFQMIYQQPVRHEFGLLKPATLLVVGLADRTTVGRGRVPEDILKDKGQYAQLGKAAAKDISNCKLVELPHVGHIPHLEAPAEFHQALLTFLLEKYKP
jgi:pimeloyl-ACP methyl ester carboxylesterase